MNRRLALSIALLFGAACKQPTTPPSAKETPTPKLDMPPEKRAPLSPEQRKAEMDAYLDERYSDNPDEARKMKEIVTRVDAMADAEERLHAIRRKTMVRPAPLDFKPGPGHNRVKLSLILEKNRLRLGEFPRIRIELMNQSSATIQYGEGSSSFFVRGGGILHSHKIDFYLTGPSGERIRLISTVSKRARPNALPRRHAPPSGLTGPELEKWHLDTNAEGAAAGSFHITLNPGESLFSLGDEDRTDGFKTLESEFEYDAPGSYQLQARLEDVPLPFDEEDIKYKLKYDSLENIKKTEQEIARNALGVASSNIVRFEVAP